MPLSPREKKDETYSTRGAVSNASATTFNFLQIHPLEQKKPSGVLFGGIIGRAIGMHDGPLTLAIVFLVYSY